MAVQRTLGVVLKRDEIRETSVLLTVYTEDFGKLKFLSKGVRSPDQKFISAYELLALCDIVFYEKKRKGFLFLSQCELVDFFPKVRESLDKLSYGVYLADLVNSVTPFAEKNKVLYNLLVECLTLLSGKASSRRVARIFEIKLLSTLGIMPSLQACAGCGVDAENKSAGFSFSMGGVLCDKCFSKDKDARPIMAGTVNFIHHIERLSLEKTANIKVSKAVGGEVENILTNFIKYHTDARLRSLDFIRKVGL